MLPVWKFDTCALRASREQSHITTEQHKHTKNTFIIIFYCKVTKFILVSLEITEELRRRRGRRRRAALHSCPVEGLHHHYAWLQFYCVLCCGGGHYWKPSPVDGNQKVFWISIKKPVSDMAEGLGKWPQLAPDKSNLLLSQSRVWQGSVLQQSGLWEQWGTTLKAIG